MAIENAKTQDKQESTSHEISLFDVKELYDLAYDAKYKGDEETFKRILSEAVKLDLAYRRHLAAESSYKDKTKRNNFKEATKVTAAA